MMKTDEWLMENFALLVESKALLIWVVGGGRGPELHHAGCGKVDP